MNKNNLSYLGTRNIIMKVTSTLLAFLNSIKSVPTPQGLTSRDIVNKTIKFSNPPRIPYCMFYYPTKGDIVDIGFISKWLKPAKPKPKNGVYVDEWGVKWRITGRWWDTAIEHPLTDLRVLSDYQFPNIVPRGMYPLFKIIARIAQNKGKYTVAPNLVNMYERMRSLMGFEELMVAPYKQPDLLEELLDHLASMTIGVIEKYGNIGLFDAFMTWEDWGLQSRLQMRVETFKKFFKPRYRRIIDKTHENNMHFIWHSCGYILDLLPEMIDLGVDVIQLDQPKLMGHKKLINSIGGKIAMWNTVDIQWSNQGNITILDIEKEIEDMISIYDTEKYKGGFIFRNYPDPEDISISEEVQRSINTIFLESI